MFSILIDKIIEDFKNNPKNKVCIDENTLLASVIEETGEKIKIEKLRQTISNFLSDSMKDDDYHVYDGAVYACSVASNHCFGNASEHEDNDDYSVDYDIEWIVNSDGSYTAEVRPS